MQFVNILRTSLPKLSSNLLDNNRHILIRITCQSLCDVNKSNETNNNKRNDMEQLFLDNRVRYLLKALTGFDPIKILSNKSLKNLEAPKYQFMTEKKLEMEIESSNKRAASKLQMPPVKYPKKYEPQILEKDVALQGFLDPSVKLIFMDATMGFPDNERLIVVREADGTLREATREERHRTNQIFYPVEERQIDLPKMFDEPHLTDILDRGSYKLLLDMACLHFEPEDPKYIEICHKTYNHIMSKNNFDLLSSTRHYGGMVFYYVFNKQADPLLYYLMQEQRINNAYNLLLLYYIINQSDKASSKIELDSLNDDSIDKIHKIESSKEISKNNFIDLLKIYIENDSNSNLTSRLDLFCQKLVGEMENNKNVAQN